MRSRTGVGKWPNGFGCNCQGDSNLDSSWRICASLAIDQDHNGRIEEIAARSKNIGAFYRNKEPTGNNTVIYMYLITSGLSLQGQRWVKNCRWKHLFKDQLEQQQIKKFETCTSRSISGLVNANKPMTEFEHVVSRENRLVSLQRPRSNSNRTLEIWWWIEHFSCGPWCNSRRWTRSGNLTQHRFRPWNIVE